MLLRLAVAYAMALGLPRILVPLALCLALGPRGRRFDRALVPALALAVGLGLLDRSAPQPALQADGVPVEARGWIVATPEQRGTAVRALLEVESLHGGTGPAPAWRRSCVRLVSRSRLPRYGARVDVHGRLRPARPPRNFGVDGESSFLARAGAAAVLDVDSLRLLPGTAGPAWRRVVLEPVRARLRASLQAVLAPREAALLEAVVVGARDRLDPATIDVWTALGVNHILSISGMHVALVAAAALALGGSPVRRRGLVLLLGAVWSYAAVGGFGPTVLRASLMATWAALALHLGRARRPFLALGVASLALVWVAPERRNDLGLQLSCAATAGLLAVSGAAARAATRLASRGRGGRFLAWAAAGATVGVAAQTATLPLQLAHFGAVAWCAPLANLVLVPLSDAALVLALAGAPAMLVWESLGRPLVLVAGALLFVTCEIARGATSLAELRWFPRVDAASVGAAWALAIAALVAAACAGAGCRRAARTSGAVAVLALLVFGVAGSRPAAPRWRVECLDVGQGDALVLAVGRSTWLVDAGDAEPVDRGARVVVPHLRRQGIRRLRGFVLSHPHRDHCGGAFGVLAAISVDTLYVAAASYDDTLYGRIRASFPNLPVRGVRRGEALEIAPGYTATVLWPESRDTLEHGANGCSVVLWAHGAGRPDLFLPGDLESDGEMRLLAAGLSEHLAGGAAARVLKAGHHGSNTSSTASFLDVVRPDIALVSVGVHNRYGHPGSRTLADLAAHGCCVLRTDRGGAIRLVQRGDALWIERPGARTRQLACGPVDAPQGAP